MFNWVESLFNFLNIDSDQFIFSSFFKNVGKILNALNPTSDTFFLKQLFTWLNPASDDFILKKIGDFFTTLLDYLNPFSDNFILLKLWDFFTSLISYINPVSDNFFGKKLIDMFQDLFQFIFVPSQERIDAITNTVKVKFEFVDSVKTAINSVKDLLNNLGNAPKITLNLKATKYTQAQNTVVFDLSWYAPYKTYGDLVITGFVYLMFIWRLLVTLPSIINGVGGSAITFEKIGSDTELHRSPFFDDRD